ncbi:hypothetical protein BCR33DRAFT_718442 [Rhizoclosmatium globosum]|uniref:Uncharacterized protein n=1 Tax=Rhizoclosmatium globosum TaxID=329046 RepID=A0A1Y2C5D2_9FUNG|nr:hypothetical protein BCR33DRAFT_718442 [Rhizoclosmatium globosum]|eukprot:ORY42252.1 hypothetical protein BCR33DRAFT_718442 [Rhizoclosmatium globosum]
MSPTLIAGIAYSDSNCKSPIRIDYTSNTTDCNPAAISSQCSKSQSTGAYFTTACVNDTSTFGDNYWHDKTMQYQSLNAGQGCGGAIISGVQYPVGSCVPVPNATGDLHYEKVLINATDASVSWMKFSDSSCSTLTSLESQGVRPQNSCISSFNKVSILNNNGVRVVTSFSGLDCSTPIHIGFEVALTKCEAAGPQCSFDLDTNSYLTVSCPQTYDLTNLVDEISPDSTYITIQSYTDLICGVPSLTETIRIGSCLNITTAGTGLAANSVKAVLSADGSSASLIYYSSSTCDGSSISSNLYPTNGGCTSFGKVLSVMKGVPHSDGGSKPSFAAIFGGGVGGLVALALLVTGFFCWRKRQREKGVSIMQGEAPRTGNVEIGTNAVEQAGTQSGFMVASRQKPVKRFSMFT